MVEAHNATLGQIVLSWLVQRGDAVVAKSANPERMKQNLQVRLILSYRFSDVLTNSRPCVAYQLVHLSPEDMATINAIHKKPGMHRNLFPFTFPGYAPGTCGGWTYEQLGWNWTPDGMVIDN